MDKEAFWDRLFAIDIDEMTETEQLYFAVNWFLCEWANGSLSQYFYNSGGEQLVLLDRALTAIGAVEAASIMREAGHVVFGNAEPKEENLPWPLPDGKSAELEVLNRRIGVEENGIWDRLDAFASSRRLYTEGPAD